MAHPLEPVRVPCLLADIELQVDGPHLRLRSGTSLLFRFKSKGRNCNGTAKRKPASAIKVVPMYRYMGSGRRTGSDCYCNDATRYPECLVPAIDHPAFIHPNVIPYGLVEGTELLHP